MQNHVLFGKLLTGFNSLGLRLPRRCRGLFAKSPNGLLKNGEGDLISVVGDFLILVAVARDDVRHRERICARPRKPAVYGAALGFPSAIGTVDIERIEYRGASENRDIIAQCECRRFIRYIVLIFGVCIGRLVNIYGLALCK